MEQTGKSTSAIQFATFEVAGLYFGVELKCVQELIRYQEMTVVPLAPVSVQGLINLRGQIVIAVDARRALGLPDRVAGELPMNVVLRAEDGCVSLLVDQIGDVVSVDEDSSTQVPENIPLKLRRMIRSVHELPERLLLIPALDKMLHCPVTTNHIPDTANFKGAEHYV